MSRVLIIASRATRKATSMDLVHGAIVGGCALALILARVPISF